MAHNKTISLDEHTAQIADKMPNFSLFVRQCLRKYAAEAEVGPAPANAKHKMGHIAPREARIWGETRDKCNPMHKRGPCARCWGVE